MPNRDENPGLLEYNLGTGRFRFRVVGFSSTRWLCGVFKVVALLAAQGDLVELEQIGSNVDLSSAAKSILKAEKSNCGIEKSMAAFVIRTELFSLSLFMLSPGAGAAGAGTGAAGAGPGAGAAGAGAGAASAGAGTTGAGAGAGAGATSSAGATGLEMS